MTTGLEVPDHSLQAHLLTRVGGSGNSAFQKGTVDFWAVLEACLMSGFIVRSLWKPPVPGHILFGSYTVECHNIILQLNLAFSHFKISSLNR